MNSKLDCINQGASSKTNDGKATSTPVLDVTAIGKNINNGDEDKNESPKLPSKIVANQTETNAKDQTDKRAISISLNKANAPMNMASKRTVQSTNNVDKTIDSDIVKNSNVASAPSTTGEITSSPSTFRTHSGYGSANSHRGQRRPGGGGTLSDSQTNSNGQGSPHENLSKTNLYIRGLASTTTDEDLYHMCVKFGNITSTKAIQDKASGTCRGYGFVLFATPQAAEMAVTELSKTGVLAQMARMPTHNEHSRHYSHQNSNNNSHYHNHHHQYQNVQHINHNSQNNHHQNLPNHHQQHHGGGNSSSGNLKMVNNNLNNHHTNSHTNIADPTNLYLANLPMDMSEVELENLLSNYGPVVSTRILRDVSSMPRGVGFARMESRDKCQEIIDKLNGKPYEGSREPLLVKFADGGNRKRHSSNHQGNNHHHSHHHNNMHHKVNHDENRWREGGDSADQNVPQSSYEHQRNLSHGNHMSGMTVMGPLGYPRIQPSFPSAIATNAPYPTALGPPTSNPQWIHPGPGQAWNVIPQQIIQSGNLGPSSQTAVPANYSFGHIPQLTSQMQGLQITHHSGAQMSGYLPQWPTMWSHHMAPHQQATQSQSVRLATPLQSSPTTSQQIPQVSTGATQTLIGVQAAPQTDSTKPNTSDTEQQISAPL